MRSNVLLLAAVAAGLGVFGIQQQAEASRLRAVVEADVKPVVEPPEAAPGVADPWVYLGPQVATVKRMAISPLDPARMIALLDATPNEPLGSVYYESASTGDAWVLSGTLGSDIHDVTFDGQSRDLLAGSFGLWVRSPENPDWDLRVHPELGYDLTTERVAVHPGAGAPVWVTSRLDGQRFVHRLSADLQQWEDVTPPMPQVLAPIEVAVSTLQPARIAVAGFPLGGVVQLHVSNDSGANWTAVSTFPTQMAITTLAWVGERLFVGGVDSATSRYALFMSADGGGSWQVALRSQTGGVGRMDVAGDPANPDRVWAGTREGVFRSTDGGETWQAPSAGVMPGVIRVVYDPVHERVWAGLANQGVWASEDQGLTWEPRNQGLGALPARTVTSNPATPAEVAAVFSGTFNNVGKLASAIDGGLAWTSQSLVDPINFGHGVRFGASGRLYATLATQSNRTVFRRDLNGGWQHIGFAWPQGTQVFPGDINFGATEDTLLVAGRIYDVNLAAYAYRLWRTGNGGQNWQQVLQGGPSSAFARIERTQGPNGLRLLVLEQSYLGEVPAHLWASDDDGLTWFDATQSLPAGTQQQYCAGDNGQLLYVHSEATSFEIQMYRSSDAGDSWTRTGWAPGSYFPGTPFTAMHCPGNAQQVFLGGSFGLLWMSQDGGNSVQATLADDTTWGDTWLESIHLSPAGLYVAHRGGVWVNPDIVLPLSGPQDLAVHQVLSNMQYRVTLSWTGGEDQVQIRRNGEVVATAANTGSWSTRGLRIGPLPSWQVCDVDGCSAVVTP